MTAPDIIRTTLAAVLDARDLDAAREVARAGLDRIEADAKTRRLIPLKQAMGELGLKDRQMRRVCHKFSATGDTVFVANKWLVDVDAVAVKRRRTP